MREQTVAMYCFLDDLLTLTRPRWARPAGPCRLSDAQVLTTALVAARFFGGNMRLGQCYREQPTSDGVPAEFYIHAGSEADGSLLCTDNAYDYALEEVFAEATGGQQLTARQARSERLHSPAQRFLIQYFRQGIETVFSQLTARFPKHIYAVTAPGFVLKLVLFILVHTLDQAG